MSNIVHKFLSPTRFRLYKDTFGYSKAISFLFANILKKLSQCLELDEMRNQQVLVDVTVPNYT